MKRKGESGTARPIRAADLDEVVRIDRERSGRSRTEFYARRFRTLAEAPGALVGVAAERGGRTAGFAFARVLDGEFGGERPAGELDAIGVDPGAVRQGVATGLLEALEAELASRQARELRTQLDWDDHGLAAFLSAAGFRLAPRVVLERTLEAPPDEDERWDDLPVRSMSEADLPAIVRLDRKITGRDRSTYYARRAAEALGRSAIRMSLVAELDERFVGFLMARVDFGEFGRAEPIAVLDTIAVDPEEGRRGVGGALLGQLLLNLSSLRAERVVTEVEWGRQPLLGFLARAGFVLSQRVALAKGIGG